MLEPKMTRPSPWIVLLLAGVVWLGRETWGRAGAVDDAPAAASSADSALAEAPAEAPPASDSQQHAAGAHDEGHGGGAHAGGHHDETDLSHANASADLEEVAPSDLNGLTKQLKSDLAIYTFLVFVLLFAVLSKFAWRPIMAGLQKREQGIAALIDEARQNAAKSEVALRQYEARLAAASEEAHALLAQAKREAESMRESIVTQAQTAAHHERDRALAEIRSARDGALREIAEHTVNTAVTMARQIVRREIKAQDHGQLIREAIEKVPGKI